MARVFSVDGRIPSVEITYMTEADSNLKGGVIHSETQ